MTRCCLVQQICTSFDCLEAQSRDRCKAKARGDAENRKPKPTEGRRKNQTPSDVRANMAWKDGRML